MIPHTKTKCLYPPFQKVRLSRAVRAGGGGVCVGWAAGKQVGCAAGVRWVAACAGSGGSVCTGVVGGVLGRG